MGKQQTTLYDFMYALEFGCANGWFSANADASFAVCLA